VTPPGGTPRSDRHVCRRDDYPGGDLNAQPSGLVLTGITTRLNRFVDHYARPQANPGAPEPARDVTAALQICPQNASDAFPADEPGERFTAASFGALAPNTLRVEAGGQQTTTSDAEPNLHAARSDPVANELTNGKRCPVEQSPGGSASAGAGVATYDSAPLERDYTMIGQTRVTVPHTGSGSGIQLNARLYDLFPGGTQVMVDRGVRRVPSPSGTTVFDLHGNAWRFPEGHRVRIELAQDDDPYIKQSNQPSSLTLSGVTLEVPVREGAASLAGTVPAQQGRRIRLSVTPRRAVVGRRTRFFFRATAGGAPVRRARIRFAGRQRRTDERGRAAIRVRLRRRGPYRARAIRRGLRSGRATVRAVRARAPRFTG
jgi:hypothetical protein